MIEINLLYPKDVRMLNLSQEEIDAIMNELEQQGKIVPRQQLEFTKSAIKCEHDWKEYIGLNQKDTYCTKCNEVKK